MNGVFILSEFIFDLKPKEDPVRTWTMRTETNERQLTNGLKLLIDHYLLKISL